MMFSIVHVPYSCFVCWNLFCHSNACALIKIVLILAHSIIKCTLCQCMCQLLVNNSTIFHPLIIKPAIRYLYVYNVIVELIESTLGGWISWDWQHIHKRSCLGKI